MWNPRALAGAWTPDQARVAGHFPGARRVCVCAANGVGKTHLAADLAVSFLCDLEKAVLITTAPTQRQVEELLWPQIRVRMRARNMCGEKFDGVQWESKDGKQALGFATDRAERMQGFHAANMLIIIDEVSGMSAELLEAVEALAVGETNYVFAIGNPNEPFGPFYDLTRRPSWVQETISALTHPNILQRREVIPGATTWASMLDRIRDWCRETDAPSEETFSLQVSAEELPTSEGVGCQALGVRGVLDAQRPTPNAQRHFLPNDAFRVRYLGRFPMAAADSLLSLDRLRAAVQRAVFAGGRTIAALDVARTGGDRTVYAVRRGDTVLDVKIIPPGDLPSQAEAVERFLREDNPEWITIDAAGLGIGLIDCLRRITQTPIREFLGSEPPVSPFAARRCENRRAQTYSRFADAVQRGRVRLPDNEELLTELAAVTYRHTEDGRLIITPKEQMRAKRGRSPDLADAVTMLWEQGEWFDPPVVAGRREEASW